MKAESQLIQATNDVVSLLDKTKSNDYNKGVADAIEILLKTPVVAMQLEYELRYAKAKNFVLENFPGLA